MSLTDIKVRSLKGRDRQYKVADGRGLFLVITPTGSKYWRFRYRIADREKSLAIGIYPDISLADARDKAHEARKLLANDKDPGAEKQSKKRAIKLAAQNTFEMVAREWYQKNSAQWVDSHGDRIIRRLEKDVFPWIGKRPITEISAPEILSVLQRIENRGAIETAHRTHQNFGQIFRYAIAAGYAENDPSPHLRGALKPVQQRHHASITDPKAIGDLLRAINSYEGFFVTKCALRLAPLFFVRPGELRKAEWSEFDLENAEWRIPASKMKMRSIHIVPICTQAITILRELHVLTGEGKYVFPGVRTPKRPMSENTVTGALRRLGYTSDEMTGHGFRSMACTILNEQGWNRDAIERQLAHAERNNIRAAYNYAEYLPERRKMMQEWANYLDSLVSGNLILGKFEQVVA
ncbi:MAG: integrase arm-type DNA-binding domain-containing protein [Gammaproteobacteria bacterium]|nr:integrase arm-type DNA-binding domain-containing protein [Gammaproteobacteria bacterium]